MKNWRGWDWNARRTEGWTHPVFARRAPILNSIGRRGGLGMHRWRGSWGEDSEEGWQSQFVPLKLSLEATLEQAAMSFEFSATAPTEPGALRGLFSDSTFKYFGQCFCHRWN